MVLCVILLAACSENEIRHEPSGKTVKIGIIGPMSGDDEAWGANGMIGVQTALQLEPYLINGDKVEFVVEDDRNTPELSAAAARKLAADEEVAALMVFSGSRAALAVAEIADSLAIPILAVASTHPQVTENKWVSQLVFNDETQGIVTALYVIDELLVEDVTVFKDLHNPHSVFLADTFTEKFAESGGTVKTVILSAGGNDYEEIFSRLGESSSSFLYLPLNADQVMAVEAASRSLFSKPQIMVSDGVLSLVILKFEGDTKLLNGILAVDVYSSRQRKTGYGRRIESIFEHSFKQPTTTISALGCEGTSLMIAAMGRCGDSGDRECINDNLRGNMVFEGFFGKIRVGRNGEVERPVFINLVSDGEMENLVKIY